MALVTVSTTLPADINTCFQLLKRTKTLCHVARPWMTYNFNQSRYPQWIAGLTLDVQPTLHIGRLAIKLGSHMVRVLEVHDETHTIKTAEHGGIIKRWDHTMHMTAVDGNLTKLTDAIIIEAGKLTPLATTYARLFYRHRQKRWQALLEERLIGGNQ